MPPLLEARDVTQVFGRGDGRTVALEGVSFSIGGEPPSFTAIVGESGSGKTTLARSLLGFLRPGAGEVRYRGKDLYQSSSREQERFRREVQAIFQDPFEVYNPFYKVDHLLSVPIRKFRLARSRAEARELIDRSLRTVGLEPRETLGRYPNQLSGGQRQRLTVARALLISPRLIIADEPVSMIDASLRASILDSLRRLHEDFGISFVYITHDLTTAYQVSDNVIVLYRGSVAEAGAVEEVIKRPLHPYTQLLVRSIPQPDPDRSWGGEAVLSEQVEGAGGGVRGCKFVDRCPHAMDVCAKSPPALYHTDVHRAAACYLHSGAEGTVEGDVSQVFRLSETAVRDQKVQPEPGRHNAAR
jgi:oligopeptide/dipeptide ABC transporter ATP-binding protein